MLLTCLVGLAQAADPIALEVVPRAQKGLGDPPGLVLVVHQPARDIKARVECGGAWAEHGGGGAKPGDRIVLGLDVNPGVHSCTGALSAVFEDGSEGEMPLSFQIEMLAPLGVQVPRDSVDVEGRKLSVVLDRQPSLVEVELFGPRDVPVDSVVVPSAMSAAGEAIEVTWTSPDEVVRIHVKGTDEHDFWGAVELFPWSYDIPHEDVIFDTNQSLIREGEAPKLEAAMVEVGQVREKYGPAIPMSLYVAGYTDTVGDKHGNQQLSNLRAASIAAWFRDNGFQGDIYYQGFGEGVLAVETPDNTDEAANRRALYVLAAETPPVSVDLPKQAWMKL
jgi:outer membrane protein OmpA-like peptidoglycan-associated protein